MNTSIVKEIERLRRMSVGELRAEWKQLYNGEETRSRNKTFLFRRLAWKKQELRYGGLGDAAKQRLTELAPAAFERATPPRAFLASLEVQPSTTTAPLRTKRDARLPPPESVISRVWRGRDIRVLVLNNGYEWEGRSFNSLSELARDITGARWNGKLFFRLTQRKRA